MAKNKLYDSEVVDPKLKWQDDWYLDRRKEIVEEEMNLSAALEISKQNDRFEQEAEEAGVQFAGNNSGRKNLRTIRQNKRRVKKYIQKAEDLIKSQEEQGCSRTTILKMRSMTRLMWAEYQSESSDLDWNNEKIVGEFIKRVNKRAVIEQMNDDVQEMREELEENHVISEDWKKLFGDPSDVNRVNNFEFTPLEDLDIYIDQLFNYDDVPQLTVPGQWTPGRPEMDSPLAEPEEDIEEQQLTLTGVPDIQAKAQDGIAPVDEEIYAQLADSKGRGDRLSESTRSEMESNTGLQLGDVRLHTDRAANELNDELGSEAFTHGQHIYFADGNYNPTTASGRTLLGHELAHTVQQQDTKGAVQTYVNPSKVKRKLRRKMFGLFPSSRDAIRAYNYLRHLDENSRVDFYNLAETDQSVADLITRMEDNLPVEYMESQRYGFQKGLEGKTAQDNVAMMQMLNSDDTWADPGMLDVVLTILVQAGMGQEILPVVNDKLTTFNTSDVTEVTEKLGFKKGKYKRPKSGRFTSSSTFPKALFNYVFGSGRRSRHQGIVAGLSGNSPYAEMIGFPLPIFQRSYGGKLGGVHFQPYEKGKKPKKPGITKFDIDQYVTSPGTVSFEFDANKGSFLCNAADLLIESMNYQFADMTERIGKGDIAGVKAKFYWEGLQEKTKDSSNIHIDSLVLNDLHTIYPDVTYAIGKLSITNITLEINQPLGTASELINYFVVLDKFLDYLTNATFLMIDSALMTLDKIIAGLGSEAGEELSKILTEFGTDAQVKISFDELLLEDFVSSKMGSINSIKIGHTEIGTQVERLAPYYQQKIDFINALAVQENREITDQEKVQIADFEKKIQEENELYTKIDALTTELNALPIDEKDKRAKITKDIDDLKRKQAVRLDIAISPAAGQNSAVLAEGVKMSDYTVKYGQGGGGLPYQPLYAGKGGTIDIASLTVSATLNAKGLIKTDFKTVIPEITLDRFRITTEKGLIMMSLDERPITVLDAEIDASMDFTQDTQTLQSVTVHKVQVKSIDITGLKVFKTLDDKGNEMELTFPVDSQTEITELFADNLTLLFPADKNGKLKIAGVMNEQGQITEPGLAQVGSATIGMGHEQQQPNMVPVLGLVLADDLSTIGFKSGLFKYDPKGGGSYTLDIADPEFFTKSGQFPAVLVNKIFSKAGKQSIVSVSLDDITGLTPFFKASAVSIMHNEQAESDQKGISTSVKLSDPEFSTVNFKSTIENQDQTIIKKKYEPNQVKWENENNIIIGGDFNLKLTGDLYAYADEDKNEWIVQTTLPSNGGSNTVTESELTIEDGDITLEYKQSEKRKDKDKQERKYLKFDYLDKVDGDASIELFGTKIPLKIEEGGYVNFVPELQQAYNLLFSHIMSGATGPTSKFVETYFIDKIDWEPWPIPMTSFGIIFKALGLSAKQGVELPMDRLQQMKFSTRVKEDFYELVMTTPGIKPTDEAIELSFIDLAKATGDNVDKSQKKVQLSAMAEFLMNEYPQRHVVSGLFSSIFESRFSTPFMAEQKKIKDARTFKQWVEFSNTYVEPTEAKLKKDLDEFWNKIWVVGNYGDVLWGDGWTIIANWIADHTTEYMTVHLIKVLQESNMKFNLGGSMDMKDGKSATGSVQMTMDNMLDPTVTVMDILVPAFTGMIKDSTLSSSGIDLREASMKITSKEQKTDFTKYNFKINSGTIKNPRMVIPRKPR